MVKNIKIRTDHDETTWIEPGKVYEAKLVESGRYEGTYTFMGESGTPIFTQLKHSVHLHGKSWEIVE